jgi:multimeric flavodoxin WrbA
MSEARKGQQPPALDRPEFVLRFRRRFDDPAYEPEHDAIERLAEIAWQAHRDGRKAPRTQPAGEGYADPTYKLSTEWRSTHDRLQVAQGLWPTSPTRTLVICGGARNDGSCPGEISKSWRLAQLAAEQLKARSIEVDLLDLSLLTSEYGRVIHPCKGCVSTAMPLCHWPCSCYPNHALGQAEDWMAEIYERWVAAHGVMIVTPTYWYQAPSPLKLMIDRMVCADGGNPDPSTTHGKKVEEAKALERAGWSYPQHLAGRVHGVVVHGDVAGVESLRRNLTDWLDWMGLIAAPDAQLDRYVGYFGPYWNSHEVLDADTAMQAEVRRVADCLADALVDLRAGQLTPENQRRPRVRPK